jgi:hypothetical protein
MAKVVAIVDSGTGKLVDSKGADKEQGRYARFAGRMMSTGDHPALDFGKAGGADLTICCNGRNGSKVKVMAGTLEVTGKIVPGEGPLDGETMPAEPSDAELVSAVKKIFVALGGEVQNAQS